MQESIVQLSGDHATRTMKLLVPFGWMKDCSIPDLVRLDGGVDKK
jgi:hypothetical protein